MPTASRLKQLPDDPDTEEKVPEVILSCSRVFCAEDEDVPDDGDGVDEQDVGRRDGRLQDGVQVAQSFQHWSEQVVDHEEPLQRQRQGATRYYRAGQELIDQSPNMKRVVAIQVCDNT